MYQFLHDKLLTVIPDNIWITKCNGNLNIQIKTKKSFLRSRQNIDFRWVQ